MGKLSSYLEENILSLGIISLLLFIPLYPKFPLFNIPGTYVAVRIEDFLVMTILLIWFFLELKHGFPVLKEKISRLILLYFAAGAVSLLSALTVTRIIVPHIAFLHFFRRIQYMSCFFIAFASVKNKKNIASFVYTFSIAVFGVLIFGLGQKYFNWPVISTMNEEFSKGMVLYLSKWTRISSTFAGHYDLAAFVVLAFSLFLGFIIGVKKKSLKLLGLGLALSAFYLLILTASRISFAAYLAAAVFVLLFTRKKWWIPPVIIFSLLAMLSSADLGQRYLATFRASFGPTGTPGGEQVALAPTPTPVEKLIPGGTILAEPTSTIVSEKKKKRKGIVSSLSEFPEPEAIDLAIQRSGEIRFKVEWPRAIRAFLKNPLLGTGYSSVTLATDNDYLRILAETGLLGLVTLCLVFLKIGSEFLIFLKKAKGGLEKALVVGIAGGIVSFLANAIFIDVFEASKVAFIFWILTGIMMGTMKDQKSKIPGLAEAKPRAGKNQK